MLDIQDPIEARKVIRENKYKELKEIIDGTKKSKY